MTRDKTQTERNIDHLNLAFLGVPLVQRAGQEATFRTRKALALLIYLAVERGIHTRDELTALFWPESDQSKGRAALRSTLAYLRRALGGPAPGIERGAGNTSSSSVILWVSTLRPFLRLTG